MIPRPPASPRRARARRAAALLALAALAPLAPAAAAAAQCALEALDVTAVQGFPENAELATRLDLSGDRLAVNSAERIFPIGPDNDTFGAVYVHAFDGTRWQLEERLFLDPSQGDAYAFDVALDGDVLAVGLPTGCVSDFFPGCPPGRVAVYERGAGGWELAAMLQPADGAIEDVFGASVDLSGERLVVGGYLHVDGPGDTQGGAWIFERIDGAWTEVARLEGAPGTELFGMAVAVDGDVVAVSAPDEPLTGFDEGALYVFEEQGGAWSQVARLELPHAPTSFAFRLSLDVDGERIALGAPRESQFDMAFPPVVDAVQNGAVYVVERVGGAWVHTDTVRAGDALADALFGADVALDGERLLVGAVRAAGALPDSGAAYLYERTPLGWAQIARFAPPTAGATPSDDFGHAVALDGPHLAVGAPGRTTSGFALNGGAHVAQLDALPCPGQSLGATQELLSLAEGGSQVLHVQAGAERAGQLYAVLGSATGTAPGVPLAGGALLLPLVPDAWFAFTLNQLGGAPFVASFGTLDAAGVATARFDLPAGVLTDPALVGLQLFHAVLVRDAAAGAFSFASNAVSLRLIP